MRGGETGPIRDRPTPMDMPQHRARTPNGGSLGEDPVDTGIGKGLGKYGSAATIDKRRDPIALGPHNTIPHDVLTSASVADLDKHFTSVVHESRRDDPHASVVDTYKKVAGELPFNMRQDALRKALGAAASDDPDTSRHGRQTFLLINARQILSLVKPHFTGDEARNEDVVQEALTTVYARMGEIDPEKNIGMQLRRILTSGELPATIAGDQNIPIKWVREGKDGEILTDLDRAVEKNGFEPLPDHYIKALAEKLSTATGYDADEIHRVIDDRQVQAVEESDRAGKDTTSAPAMKHARTKVINNALSTLDFEDEEQNSGSIKEEVIRERYGLADGQPKTLGQIGEMHGKTPNRIRQIEIKGLEILSHPRRADFLRDFRDLEEED